MGRLRPEVWQPSGVDDLEPNAWNALRSEQSLCITAGPGAGKTEFLAQRAAYLLQTGICRYPQQILAISFKRDAARNLRERVAQRCPPEQARRFVSITYDAFAKSLLDRFINVIPELWRPWPNYRLEPVQKSLILRFLQYARENAFPECQSTVQSISERNFEEHWIGRRALGGETLPACEDRVLQLWWQAFIGRKNGGQLTHTMVNRLAEQILRTNAHVRKAVRATYPFVFLDEFQDTTYAQYGLVKTAFCGSHSVLTAVGDNKQRIMVWAGARPDAFDRFTADFGANSTSLICNHRSRPELVAIQQVVATALDARSPSVESRANKLIDGAFAEMWTFPNADAEAEYLVKWLSEDSKRHNLGPRDYVLLARQKVDDVEQSLRKYFSAYALGLRNESRLVEGIALQDLLVEDLSEIAMGILDVAIRDQAPQSLESSYYAVCDLQGGNRDSKLDLSKARKSLHIFLLSLKPILSQMPTADLVQQLVKRVIAYIDPTALQRCVIRYSLGDTLSQAIKGFQTLMLESYRSNYSTWGEVLDHVMGTKQTPLMTIHKSKGLEFHTVAFLRLDDDQWWGHKADSHESIATFFVGLSRAKQRVFFTFCRDQSKTKVSDLHALLKNAGVTEVAF
jgi:superfamily I DNA/RNA helicase